MVRRICDITVTSDCIFRLVHCFIQQYLSECVGRHQTVLLETPFKGDNEKALVKTSNCENLVLYVSEKVQKISAFAMLCWFSVTKQYFENGFGFPQ